MRKLLLAIIIAGIGFGLLASVGVLAIFMGGSGMPGSTSSCNTSGGAQAISAIPAAAVRRSQPVGSSGALSAVQVAQVVRAAGWTGDNVAIAVAVSKGESGWIPDRLEIAGGHGHGLFQIDDRYHALGNWSDPQANADAAFKIWQSQGWSSGWTVYRTGAYLQYMSEAQSAAFQTALSSGPVVHTSPDVTAQVASIQAQPVTCRAARTSTTVTNAFTKAGVGPGGSDRGRGAAAFTLGHLGLTYVYGGNSLQTGTDCSGWTQFAWASQGIQLPRTAALQAAAVPHTTTPVPGSLAWPLSEWRGGNAGHVELVIAVHGSTVVTSQEPHSGAVSYVGNFPASSFIFGTPA
jgi:cell wall-associated NlpC family hydrolase